MDRAPTLSRQLRDWYDHSPKARRAMARHCADVSAVRDWATPKARELRGRVAPAVDPASTSAPGNGNGRERKTGAPT